MTIKEKLNIKEPESALPSFWYALGVAEKENPPLEHLIKAVDALDRDFLFTLKDFSDATVVTDKAKLKLQEESFSKESIDKYNRALSKEKRCLEIFEDNMSSPDILRDFLVSKIVEKGVKISPKNIGCCKSIIALYKTRSRLSTLKSKGFRVDKELKKLVSQFAEYGISLKL